MDSGTQCDSDLDALVSKRKKEHIQAKVEHFLTCACEAEERGDYFRAGRYFVRALYCEGKLRNNGSRYAYVWSALPLY